MTGAREMEMIDRLIAELERKLVELEKRRPNKESDHGDPQAN